MTNNQYRIQWIKWHKGYERSAFRLFRDAINMAVSRMPIDSITYQNYPILIELNVRRDPINKAYVQVYRSIGLIHGERVGNGINREIKDFSGPLFSKVFQNTIIEWVARNCGDRITSVVDTIAKRIRGYIQYSLSENYTVAQMQKYLRDQINSPNFTRNQAYRIARTETTTASNHAATVAGETSGIVLDKVWISTHDNRTRDGNPEDWNHKEMDGVIVGENDTFNMVSTKGEINNILYPGAPNASAGNCINCRCTNALKPRRDARGFVIMK